MPLLLTAALAAFILSVSDLPSVAHHIRGLSATTVLSAVGLAIFYLILRAIQLHLLLEGLRIRSTWKEMILALAVGEMAITIPAGEYAQNWVLRRLENTDFSRSSAATTAMMFSVGVVGLSTLAILGIPGLGLLRPVIFGIFGAALLIIVLTTVGPVGQAAARVMRSGPLGQAGPELLELLEGLRTLFNPTVISRLIPLTTIHLVSLLAAFYIVAHGVGVTELTAVQAVTVYLFAITIGFVEAGGLRAMEGWGYSPEQALAVLLAFRVIWTGSIWLICGLVVFLLRGELSHQPAA